MTLADSARGTSVAELLDQAEDLLYAIAQDSPSGNRVLAAWPAYAAACARLTVAAVGPRASGHAAVARRPDTDSVLVAGLRFDAHVQHSSVSTRHAVAHPAMARVTQLIGAAADLIECAQDRPGVGLRDAAQTEGFRRAGIVRAAELALTGVDLTIRACGLTHQQSPSTSPNSPDRLTSRATPLFTTRRHAAAVLDAAAGRVVENVLDDVRVPSVNVARPRDPLDRLHLALRDWRTASLETAHSPAVSSAELQRASVEARQVVALAAAVTDAAQASGLLPPPVAVVAMAQLQRAGAAWAAVTDGWTRFTTGVQPSHAHVQASLELQHAIRAISRAEGGAWLTPQALTNRVDLPGAREAVHRGLGDVLDVARTHHETVRRIVRRGQVFAHASSLPLNEDRVAARLRGQHVPVTASEGAGLHLGYAAAVERTLCAHAKAAEVAQPRTAPVPITHGARELARAPAARM